MESLSAITNFEEGFDAVIRSGALMDSAFSAKCLGGCRMQVVGAPAYFSVHGIPKVPADLARHACIHFRSPVSGRLQPCDRHGALDCQGLARTMGVKKPAFSGFFDFLRIPPDLHVVARGGIEPPTSAL